MQLLIAVGIDANDEVLPLACALVPIENSEWWAWFFEQIKDSFNNVDFTNFVFMSDWEKGILNALKEEIPKAI